MVYPDQVASILKQDSHSKRIQFWGPDFIKLDNEQYFVRVMLPVKLDVGHEFRFGVWMEVNLNTVEHLKKVWDGREYLKTTFKGTLANSVPPWGDKILGAECEAKVRDTNSVPFIKSSKNKVLSNLLTNVQPVHEIEAIIEKVWK